MPGTRSKLTIEGSSILSQYPEERKRKRKRKELETETVERRDYKEIRSRSVETPKLGRGCTLPRTLSTAALIDCQVIKPTSQIRIDIDPQIETKIQILEKIRITKAAYTAKISKLHDETVNILTEIDQLETFIPSDITELPKAEQNTNTIGEFPVSVRVNSPTESLSSGSSEETIVESLKSCENSPQITNARVPSQKRLELFEHSPRGTTKSAGNSPRKPRGLSKYTPQRTARSAGNSPQKSPRVREYSPQKAVSSARNTSHRFLKLPKTIFRLFTKTLGKGVTSPNPENTTQVSSIVRGKTPRPVKSHNLSSAGSEEFLTPHGTPTPFDESIILSQSPRRTLFPTFRIYRKKPIQHPDSARVKGKKVTISQSKPEANTKPVLPVRDKKRNILVLQKGIKIKQSDDKHSMVISKANEIDSDQSVIKTSGDDIATPSIKTKLPSDKDKVKPTPRKINSPTMVNHNQVVSLRDALAVIPEYDGKTSSLGAFIQGCEEAVEMLEPESEKYLVKAVRVKIKGEPRRTIHLNTFESIDELIDFLKSIYAPSRNIYQLQGELGAIYQKQDESVIAYSNRLRDVGFQILDAYEFGKSNEADEAFKKNTEDSLPACFINGLRPEIEQRMGRHNEIDDAVKEAVKIEREIAARAALRGEKISPPEPRGNKTDKRNVNVVTSEETTCQVCKKTGHTAPTCPTLKQNNAQLSGTQEQKPEQKINTVCQMCNKIGHFADKCFKLFPPQNKNQATIPAPMITVCQVCNKRGHTADKCFRIFPPGTKNPSNSAETCQLCKKPGHSAANCSQLPRGSQTPMGAAQVQVPQGLRYQPQDAIKCQICKKDGHGAHICPYRNYHSQSLDQNQPGTRRTYAEVASNSVCHYCKTPGHFIRECPKRIASESTSRNTSGNEDGPPSMGARGETARNMHPVRIIKAAEFVNPEL